MNVWGVCGAYRHFMTHDSCSSSSCGEKVDTWTRSNQKMETHGGLHPGFVIGIPDNSSPNSLSNDYYATAFFSMPLYRPLPWTTKILDYCYQNIMSIGISEYRHLRQIYPYKARNDFLYSHFIVLNDKIPNFNRNLNQTPMFIF